MLFPITSVNVLCRMRCPKKKVKQYIHANDFITDFFQKREISSLPLAPQMNTNIFPNVPEAYRTVVHS